MDSIRRIILDCGHGPGNGKGGAFDPGATSSYGTEHRTVSLIASGVRQALARTIPCVIAPELSLPELISWVNDELEPGDFLLSLHMNAGGGTGTEVIYSAAAPFDRAEQARGLSAIIASMLRLPDRGAKKDSETPRGRLGILRQTKCPALLIELAFVDNRKDMARVEASGMAALAAGIRWLMGYYQAEVQ